MKDGKQQMPKPEPLEKYSYSYINRMWEGELFEEKEVSVYYKLVNDTMILLTVKARYGKGFLKEGEDNETRI